MLKEPKWMKARAAKMLEMKILEGATNAQIAKKFNLTERTVETAMTLARKGDIVVSFEDKLMNELLPLAHSALRDSLMGIDGGNAKVALEIFKGAGIIRPNSQSTARQEADANDLSSYIAAKRRESALLEETYDAELSQLALPPAPDSADPTDRPSHGEEVAARLAGSPEVEPQGAEDDGA